MASKQERIYLPPIPELITSLKTGMSGERKLAGVIEALFSKEYKYLVIEGSFGKSEQSTPIALRIVTLGADGKTFDSAFLGRFGKDAEGQTVLTDKFEKALGLHIDRSFRNLVGLATVAELQMPVFLDQLKAKNLRVVGGMMLGENESGSDFFFAYVS